MTLDEAIKHAEEVMEDNLVMTKHRNASDPVAINCFECADEHRQLAEWLKELKAYKEQEPCKDAVSKADMIAFLEQGRKYVSRNRDQYKTAREFDIADTIYVNLVQAVEHLPPVRPQEQTGKCRTCKYGEIYNDLWCKCHDPLLNGVMVKMTDQCRAEEIIDLNRKYKAERRDKE